MIDILMSSDIAGENQETFSLFLKKERTCYFRYSKLP